MPRGRGTSTAFTLGQAAAASALLLFIACGRTSASGNGDSPHDEGGVPESSAPGPDGGDGGRPSDAGADAVGDASDASSDAPDLDAAVDAGPIGSDASDAGADGPIWFDGAVNLVNCSGRLACNSMPPGGQGTEYEVRFGSFPGVDCVEGSDASANCLPGSPCQIYSFVLGGGTCAACAPAAQALPDGSFPDCDAGTTVVCNSVPSGCVYASGPFWCCP
jgi:hypothetical protein